MNKFEKRVSINSLDKVAKENFEAATVQEWYGVELHIRRFLGLTDVLEFTENVVASCFGEDGAYLPEVFDFAVKSNILTKYANLTLPENLTHRYDLIYGTDAVDTVCNYIDVKQLHEIISAADRKIKYLCDAGVTAIRKKLDELIAAFEGMQKKTENVFNGISHEDIEKLIDAVANGGFDENRLVEAYVTQMRGNEQEEAVANEQS